MTDFFLKLNHIFFKFKLYYYVHGIRAINWLEQHRVWICDVRITQKLFLYTIFINMTTFLWILLPLNGSSFDIANFIKFTAFIDFFVRGICKHFLFALYIKKFSIYIIIFTFVLFYAQ